MRTTKVKFCGLTSVESVEAAASAGADYIGLVFFPKSPRNVSIDTAAALASSVPMGISRVALTVDPDDDLLDRIVSTVSIDLLQLHGTETPPRVSEIKSRFGLPVMKSIGIGGEADLDRVAAYEGIADRILLDKKPSPLSVRPGGNAEAFDWELLSDFAPGVPWMLAGGLTPKNVRVAVETTGAREVDVSSGVEKAPGEKDPALMQRFVEALR